jgi:hypothetical protein
MSRLARAIRSRREYRNARRALRVAISSNAATPSLRDELVLVGQRTDETLRPRPHQQPDQLTQLWTAAGVP